MRTPIDTVKASATEVFTILGSGHSEAVYEAAMDVELLIQSHWAHRRQVPVVLTYKENNIGTGFIDILFGEKVVVEIKAIAKLSNKDVQQVKKYLAATGLEQGLLINFGNDLEIVEVHNKPGGILRVPFELSNEDLSRLGEAWEKGNNEQTPSTEN